MARGKKGTKIIETSPTPGHNSERSEEQKQALFLQHAAKVRVAEAAVEAAKKALKSVKEGVKIELGKEAVAEIALANRLMADETLKETMKAKRAKEDRILLWIGLPTGSQGELFANDAEVRARDDGKRAGMVAAERRPPNYFSGSVVQHWLEGYDAGQEVARSLLKDALTAPGDDESEEQDDRSEMDEELPMGDE